MNPRSSTCLVMLTGLTLLWLACEGKRYYAQICEFNGTFICSKPSTRHTLSKYTLPSNACFLHECSHCVKGVQTFLILPNEQLIEPTSFLLTASHNETDRSSTIYECQDSTGKFCECDNTTCSGSLEFCKIHNCTPDSSCFCAFTHLKPLLVATTTEIAVENPRLLTIEVCLFDNRFQLSRSPHSRKLLEGESASFTHNNLSIKFEDPFLTLPTAGRVILRTSELEHVIKVPSDLIVTIPFEILAFKTQVTVIFISDSGQTVQGTFHVTGKTVCQVRHCLFCWSALQHFKCFPVFIKYILYCVTAFLIVLSLILLKSVIKSLLLIFKLWVLACLAIFKLLKLIARGSLLLGVFVGDNLRNIFITFYAHLERNAQVNAPMNSLPLVVIALLFIVGNANAECNTHAIISSDLKTCQTLQDGTKSCQLFTTAEISLPTISSEVCLWITDKKQNHLFSLTLKLEAVKCHFTTERSYFTFPVSPRHISQISCIYNQYCGRGVHCLKSSGQQNVKFEAENEESKSYPGISGCLPSGLGSGCAIITRPACNFHKTWYIPDLLKSYEVSKIRGHECKYHISVLHNENNTISRLTLTDSAYTSTGVRIKILGAYSQPQIHINEDFIQRVGSPSEGYLAPASERNAPEAGKIGAVQANVSYTTSFIFDPALTTCDYFEDNLRCITAPDALSQMFNSKENALPLQRDIHLFSIENGQLQSSLLMSSAVRVQLHFTNLQITVKAHNICPKFFNEEILTAGCYKCSILARITFKAFSTCETGIALVEFQDINLHTKAIRLSEEPTVHIVKFYAEQKCYTEKLCLKTPTLIQCLPIKFCLEEPSVELLQLNTNYTKTLAQSVSSSWSDRFQIPNFSASLHILKLLGSSLLIICLIITIVSTSITCCCRSR